ncbi:hypothetical protein Tco_1146835 [Tanacetum coccineum]
MNRRNVLTERTEYPYLDNEAVKGRNRKISLLYTDHSDLKYLLAKQDSKPRLLQWILLLQEFDVIIRDKKGAENLAADHLSRLENPHQDVLENKEITETFPLETLGMVTFRGDSSTPWFADIANYHVGNFICDSVFYKDFSEVDTLTSTDNEDKVFNSGILIHENHFEVTNYATNVKKTTNTSLILEDFNPPLYELPFHEEVPGSEILLSFSFENEEKVFNPGILTSKVVHTSLLPEISHRGPKAFKVIKIFESPMEIFTCSYGEDIRVLDVPCLHFYPP